MATFGGGREMVGAIGLQPLCDQLVSLVKNPAAIAEFVG
jgi:hypothetical protein